MPIYDYECRRCCERFEKFRNISDDDAEVRCPSCGAAAPKRVMSTFSTGTSSGSGGGFRPA